MWGWVEAANRAPGLGSRLCLCFWLTEFLTYTFCNEDLGSPSVPLVQCTITSRTGTRSASFILMVNDVLYCCHISASRDSFEIAAVEAVMMGSSDTWVCVPTLTLWSPRFLPSLGFHILTFFKKWSIPNDLYGHFSFPYLWMYEYLVNI